MDEDLDSEFHLKGRWWLPGVEPEEAGLDGTLHYSPREPVRLELGDALRTPEGDAPDQVPVILGRTESGPASILRARRGLPSVNIMPGGGWGTYPYLARYLVIGDYLDEGIDAPFDWVSISYSNLEAWMGLRPAPALEEDNGELQLRLQRFEDRDFTIEGSDFDIGLGATVRRESPKSTTVSVSQRGYLRVRPDGLRPVAWFLDIIEEFQLLLSLFVGYPVYPLRVMLHSEVEENEPARPLRLYFPQGDIDIPQEWPAPFLVLSLETLGDQFPTAVSRWFETRETLEPLTDLFLGGRYRPPSRERLRLLSLTQGLEGYHRLRHGGAYQTKEDYEDAREALTSAIPDGLEGGHKAALRSRIKYGYQYSLRKRLSELVNRLPGNLPPLAEENRDAFISSVVTTRNYYTHYDPDDEGEALEGEDLALTNRVLEVIATTLVAEDLGIDPGDALEGAQSSFAYNYLWPDGEE